MESRTPAGKAAKGQPIVPQADACAEEARSAVPEMRDRYFAIETERGIEYVNSVLWCQCCGAMVTGPQVRDHKPGDTVRLIGQHVAEANEKRVLIREGKEAKVESINNDGAYVVVVSLPVFGSGFPLSATLTVWPGQIEEEVVR